MYNKKGRAWPQRVLYGTCRGRPGWPGPTEYPRAALTPFPSTCVTALTKAPDMAPDSADATLEGFLAFFPSP